MRNYKSGLDAGSSDSGLCKNCITDGIKNHQQDFVLLCFNCKSGGASGVKIELKDSKLLKTLLALCAEI